MIDFARGIAVPFSEAHRGAPVPGPIITAWALFSGLGTYGIRYVPRPNNPYDRVSLDSTTVDTLQFARETLTRKSGDCADVVALLASALESMTVTTCALDAPGHLFLMFDTGETQREALGFPKTCSSPMREPSGSRIEATMLGISFMDAWKQGADEYRRWSAQGKVHPIDMHLAWRTFEPATLPETAAAGPKAPKLEADRRKISGQLEGAGGPRWQTGLAEGKAAAAASPASGAPWLRLGFLAVEFKRYEEAKDYFLKARADAATAASAYNNLGNLAFLQGDMETALSDYTQARGKRPERRADQPQHRPRSPQAGHPQKASAAYEKAIGLEQKPARAISRCFHSHTITSMWKWQMEDGNMLNGHLPFAICLCHLPCSSAFAEDVRNELPTPSNLQAIVLKKAITLSWAWQAPEELPVFTDFGYEIKRQDGKMFRASATTWIDADLAPGTYGYMVRARGMTKEKGKPVIYVSDWSGPVDGTIKFTCPRPPTIELSVEPTQKKLRLHSVIALSPQGRGDCGQGCTLEAVTYHLDTGAGVVHTGSLTVDAKGHFDQFVNAYGPEDEFPPATKVFPSPPKPKTKPAPPPPTPTRSISTSKAASPLTNSTAPTPPSKL